MTAVATLPGTSLVAGNKQDVISATLASGSEKHQPNAAQDNDRENRTYGEQQKNAWTGLGLPRLGRSLDSSSVFRFWHERPFASSSNGTRGHWFPAGEPL